jgi:hypothetical protein
MRRVVVTAGLKSPLRTGLLMLHLPPPPPPPPPPTHTHTHTHTQPNIRPTRCAAPSGHAPRMNTHEHMNT